MNLAGTQLRADIVQGARRVQHDLRERANAADEAVGALLDRALADTGKAFEEWADRANGASPQRGLSPSTGGEAGQKLY